LRIPTAEESIVARHPSSEELPCDSGRAEGVAGTVEVKRFVGRRIRPGRRLEARITRSGFKTVYKTVTIKRSGPPVIVTECSETGSGERGPC
jgi:hypothetical protein